MSVLRPRAAVILAAGEGRRMGGPKALLTLEGESLVRLHARRLAALCPVLAVVRPRQAPRVRALLEGLPARVLEGEAATQSGSLALALAELAKGSGLDFALFVTPVDVLPASEATLRALCAALAEGALAATPSHRGRGGHPVLVRGSLLAPLLEGAAEPPSLRDLLRAAGSRRVRIEVDEPAITRDFDTPEEARDAGLERAAGTASHARRVS